MNALNNEAKIKLFLLKHKKTFQECLDKHITANCFYCPMQEVKTIIPSCNYYNCSKVYEYIATSLGKQNYQKKFLKKFVLFYQVING